MASCKQKRSFAPLPMRGDRHAEMQGKKLFVFAAISIIVLVGLVLLLFSYDSDHSIAGEAFRAVTETYGVTSCFDGQVCLYTEIAGVSSVINDGTLNPGDEFELIVGYVPNATYTNVSFGEVTISYDSDLVSIDSSSGITWSLDSTIWDIQFEHESLSSTPRTNQLSLVFASSSSGQTMPEGVFVPIARIPFEAGDITTFQNTIGTSAFQGGSTEELNIQLSNAFLEYYDSSRASLVDIFTSIFLAQNLNFDVGVNPLFHLFDADQGVSFPIDGSILDLGELVQGEGSETIYIEAFDYDVDIGAVSVGNDDLDLRLDLQSDGVSVSLIDSGSSSFTSDYIGFDSALTDYRQQGSDYHILQWPVTFDFDSMPVGEYSLVLTLYNEDGGEVEKTVEFEIVSGDLPEIISINGIEDDFASLVDLGNFDNRGAFEMFIVAEDSDYDGIADGVDENVDLELTVGLYVGDTLLDFLDTSSGYLSDVYLELVEESVPGEYTLIFKEDASTGDLILDNGDYSLSFNLDGTTSSGGSYVASFSIVNGELQVTAENMEGYVNTQVGNFATIIDADGIDVPEWSISLVSFTPLISGSISTFDITTNVNAQEMVAEVHPSFDWIPTLSDIGDYEFELTATASDGETITKTFTLSISESVICDDDSAAAYYSLIPDGNFVVSNDIRDQDGSRTITVEAGEQVDFFALVVDDQSHLGDLQLVDVYSQSSFGSARAYTPSDREDYSWSDSWTPTVSDIGSHTFGLNVDELCGNGFRAGLDTTVTVTVVEADSLPGVNDPTIIVENYETPINAGESQDLYVSYMDSVDFDAPVTVDVEVISATAGIVEALSYSIGELTASEIDSTTSEWEIYVPFVQDTPGTYSVQLTVTDESENVGSDSVEIVVEEVSVDSSSSGEGSSGTEDTVTESYELELSLEVTGPTGSVVTDLDDLVVGDEYVFDVVITALEDMGDHIVFLQIEDSQSGEVYFVDYSEEGSLAAGESQTSNFEFDVEEDLSYVAKVFVWSDRASEGGERLLPMQVME